MTADLQKHRRAPGKIRTCDTRFRRAVLYPLSYEGGGPARRVRVSRRSSRREARRRLRQTLTG